MVSPAQAHYMRATAAAGLAAAAAPVIRANANQYELMLAKLTQDRIRLKAVQSIERKAEVKRQLLPEYQPWIEGTLQGDAGQQDDVFMTVMVWTIDIGDIAAVLPLAAYAIRHKLVLPDQYQRTTACLIAEEAAEIALKTGDVEQLASLLDVEKLVADQDMPDEVRAKLLKAIGYATRTSADYAAAEEKAGILEQAKTYLVRALELHAKVGVKKDIEKLDVLIKNSAPPVNPEKTEETGTPA